jgi:hypothetical protein
MTARFGGVARPAIALVRAAAAAGLAIAGGVAATPSQAATDAGAAALRPCAVLSTGIGNGGDQGEVDDQLSESDRTLARLVESRLMDRGYVVRMVFVEPSERTWAVSKPQRALQFWRCGTQVEIDHVLERSTMLLGSFGFDVVVRHRDDAANAPAAMPTTVTWKKHYRYLLDQPNLDAFRMGPMASAIVDDLVASQAIEGVRGRPVDPAVVRAEYERLVAADRGAMELHVRHILLRTEGDANYALARIVDAHEDFAAVAHDASIDTASAEKGGDLGWSLPSVYVPAFAAAIVNASPRGRVDHVVHTPFGWHVVEVLDQRPLEPPAFEAVKDRVAAVLRWQQVVPAVDAAARP